jgi:hypothetical protein
MIIGAINASKDPQYSYPLGGISLSWSHLPRRQEAHQGETKYPLAETPQLSNGVCNLLRGKCVKVGAPLLQTTTKSALFSSCQVPRLAALQLYEL